MFLDTRDIERVGIRSHSNDEMIIIEFDIVDVFNSDLMAVGGSRMKDWDLWQVEFTIHGLVFEIDIVAPSLMVFDITSVTTDRFSDATKLECTNRCTGEQRCEEKVVSGKVDRKKKKNASYCVNLGCDLA